MAIAPNAGAAVGLTFDVDWAPDFILDDIAERLERRGLRSTWFVTHASPAIDRLRRRPDLFELGIHPNFLPGSSHGNTASTVLRHCMEIVPEARAIRTHCLVQSTPLIDQMLLETPVAVDVSLFLPRARHVEALTYHWRGRQLVRLPYVWEDDYEMECPEPMWDVAPLLRSAAGVCVLDFHPIHVYLNGPSTDAYRRLKALGRPMQDLTRAETERFVVAGDGPGRALDRLLDAMSAWAGSNRLSDLVPRVAPAAGHAR